MADPETEWWFWTIIALIILGISACVFEYFMERRKDEDLENDEIQIVHKKIRVKNHRSHKRRAEEYDDQDGHYDDYENDVKSEDVDDSEETLEYREKRRRRKHRHQQRHGRGFHMPHANQTGGGPLDPNDLNNYAAVNYHPKYEYNFFIPNPHHGPFGPPGLGPHPGAARPPFRKQGPIPKSDSESKRFPGRPMPYSSGPYAYPPYPPYPMRMPRHPARPQNLSISSSAHNPTPTRRPVHKQAPHPKPAPAPRPNYNYVPPAKVVPQTHENPFEEETSDRMVESDTTYNDVESLGEIEDDVELLEVTQQLQDARRALDMERENARMREQQMAEVHQKDIEMMVLKHEELEDVNDSLRHTMNQEKERNRQEMERNRQLETKLQEELRGHKALEQALKREHDIHAQLEEQLRHMKRTPKADYMEKKMEKIKRVRSKNRSVHGSGKYSLQSLNSGRFPSHSHSPSTGHLAAPTQEDTRNRKESWLTEISGTDSLDEFDFEQQKRKSYVNDQLLSSLEQFEPPSGLDDAKSDHSSIIGSENSSMRMPSAVPSIDFDINKEFDRNVRQFESAIGSAMHDILEAGEDSGLHLDPVVSVEDVGVRLNRVYSNADEEEVEVLHRFTVEKHSTVRRITLDRATTLEKNTAQDDEVNKIMADAAIEEAEMDDVLAELHALIGDADDIQEQEIGEMEMLREQIEEALALADDDEPMSVVNSPPSELPPTIYGAASPSSIFDTLSSDPNTISSAYDTSRGISSPHHDMVE